MKKLPKTVLAAVAAIGLASAAGAAGAATIGSDQDGARLITGVYSSGDQVQLVQAQWAWQGRQYCWYPNGWRGPGYYQCGFAMRRGFGWGGPAGWNGWRYDRGMGGGRGWHRGWRDRRDWRDHRDWRDRRDGDRYPR
jgi:hypothetical protein